MYTPSCMILSFLTSKTFLQKSPKFRPAADFSVSGLTGRPARSTGASTRTCTLVHVCRPTAPVDRLKAGHSRVFWVDRPVDRLQKPVFLFIGRSTRPVDRSPTATATQADGRPDRSTAKPAEPQRLFPLLSISEICFCNLFWQTFSGFLENFFRSNKLIISEF